MATHFGACVIPALSEALEISAGESLFLFSFFFFLLFLIF
jgi:hypothetical protein